MTKFKFKPFDRVRVTGWGSEVEIVTVTPDEIVTRADCAAGAFILRRKPEEVTFIRAARGEEIPRYCNPVSWCCTKERESE